MSVTVVFDFIGEADTKSGGTSDLGACSPCFVL